MLVYPCSHKKALAAAYLSLVAKKDAYLGIGVLRPWDREIKSSPKLTHSKSIDMKNVFEAMKSVAQYETIGYVTEKNGENVKIHSVMGGTYREFFEKEGNISEGDIIVYSIGKDILGREERSRKNINRDFETPEIERFEKRFGELVDKEMAGDLSAEEKEELESLDRLRGLMYGGPQEKEMLRNLTQIREKEIRMLQEIKEKANEVMKAIEARETNSYYNSIVEFYSSVVGKITSILKP